MLMLMLLRWFGIFALCTSKWHLNVHLPRSVLFILFVYVDKKQPFIESNKVNTI